MIKHVRRYFITGILVIFPLFLSIYILFILFRFVDGILGRFINVYFKETLGFYIPGLGLILFLLIIIVAGFLSTHFLGRRLNRFLDRIVGPFPLLRHIYPWIRQIFTFLFSKNNLSFKKVVLVGYPCKGSWSLGFITNEGFKEAKLKSGQELLSIFVPLVPNPTSGFLIFASSKDVIFLDISIKEAMKLILSGGILNPVNFSKDGKNVLSE